MKRAKYENNIKRETVSIINLVASFWLLWQQLCLRGRRLEEEEEEERTWKRGCAEKKVTAKTEPSGG